MVRVLVHDNQVIEIKIHVFKLISFITHLDVTSYHIRGESKVYQGI